MASVALTWGLTEPFEVEAACASVSADVYLLLTLFKVLVFDSGLTLIPLCNRLKERYACGPSGAQQDWTGPVNWPKFAIGGAPKEPRMADRRSPRMLQSEPAVAINATAFATALRIFGWPAFS
jgi:hypothetical protein